MPSLQITAHWEKEQSPTMFVHKNGKINPKVIKELREAVEKLAVDNLD